MNGMRWIYVVVIIAGLLSSGFTASAVPIGEPTRVPAALNCEEAYRAAAAVDIPARRAEYYRVDNLSECARLGIPLIVPVTGANRAPAFLYDATGAMNAAVQLSGEAAASSPGPAFIYDATGAMQDAVVQPPSNR